ncbi:DNA-binding transcriptional regulator, MerR family [Monaibacterium marinum]|uniref:DNA-binding transcriptional regulator, MerR family n=1 Tax=Pontivivens marinum TaxID=1690039 RepID=A0A2C9CSK7_9RHOB|nr:MerR family transcriptional regulator [Monaibacterium marinum]SOH94324.1 DNA-binding transcriptional regulator, MerR family [Monaibacterium marinum]
MRIGELAERSGVSRDTIRFYERNGLIRSIAGTSDTNNYRDYPEDNLTALDFFSKARTAGISIADLRDIMQAIAGSCDRADAITVIRAKISELQERATQVQNVIKFLEQSIDGD